MINGCILIGILAAASYFDLKKSSIPNPLVFCGILWGLVTTFAIPGTILKLLALLFLFFFGMLHLMGMGDIKLWMAVACFTGFIHSCLIIAGAELLLILYGLVRNRKEAVLIIKHMEFSALHKSKTVVMEQNSYPFAVFILLGTLCYYIIMAKAHLL